MKSRPNDRIIAKSPSGYKGPVARAGVILPVSGLEERYFTGSGIVGNEVVNPYGDNARLVKSFCVKGNASTSEINYGVLNLSNSGSGYTQNLSVEFRLIAWSATPNDATYVIGEWDGNNRAWHLRDFYHNSCTFLLGDSAGAYKGGITVSYTSNLALGDVFKIVVVVEGTGLRATVYKNGVANGTTLSSLQDRIYHRAGVPLRILRYVASSSGGTFCDFKIYRDNVIVFNAPMQGSAISILPAVNPTVTGITFVRQNYCHYNILNGFDYYLDTATGLVPLYVPYVGGTPVVSSVSGYTKQSSNPAGKWHNQAETYVRFPAGSIFDKSDVANWSADLRALATYDSSNPTDWAGYELSPNYFQTYWTGAKNMIFSASDYNEYVYLDGAPSYDDTNGEMNTYPEDKTSVREILVYSTARTKNTIISIVNWIKSKVGVGR